MNKTKHYIKKIFRHTDFSGLSVFGRNQTFDWEILLAFFLLVTIVTVSFSVYVFIGVRAGDIFSNSDNTPVHNETIDRNVLDQVINNFATHASNLKSLQAQKPVFIDPSL
jgi:hypothetical protein